MPYHVVTHWAALVATAGLLATIVLLIATAGKVPSPNLVQFWICIGVIAGLSGAGIVFAWRMIRFSNWVKKLLSAPAEYEQHLFSHKQFFVISLIGFIGLGTAGIFVLCIN
jgi:hypothetical protein